MVPSFRPSCSSYCDACHCDACHCDACTPTALHTSTYGTCVRSAEYELPSRRSKRDLRVARKAQYKNDCTPRSKEVRPFIYRLSVSFTGQKTTFTAFGVPCCHLALINNSFATILYFEHKISLQLHFISRNISIKIRNMQHPVQQQPFQSQATHPALGPNSRRKPSRGAAAEP